MKISKEKNAAKQTGSKGWIEKFGTGPYRWLWLSGILIFALMAGFFYAWKFKPRSAVEVAVQPSATPTSLPPTPIIETQEDIQPFPMMQIDFTDDLDGDIQSAALMINGGNEQTAALQKIYSTALKKSGWLIHLSEENPDLHIAGVEFELIPAEGNQIVTDWVYANQMRDAGIHVPDFMPALVSIDGNAASVYYLVSSEGSSTGIVFQLPLEFFTIKPYNIPDQEAVLAEVAASAQSLQKDLPEEELNDLITYLSAMMRYPEEMANGFSIELFSKYFAIHDVWAASYADLSTTPMYIFNLESNTIEPAIQNINQIILSGNGAEPSFPFSNHPLYGFSEMQIAYATALSEQSTLQKFVTLQEDEYPVFHAYEKQIKESTGEEYSALWEFLNFRHKMMRLQLDPPYPVRGFVYREPGKNCINVSVLNLMVLPVEVERVNLFGMDISLQYEWLQNPTGAAILEASDDILRLQPFDNPDILMNFCVPVTLFDEILLDQEVDKPLDDVLREENTWTIEANISGLEKSYTVSMIPDIPPLSGGKRDMPPVQTIQQITDTFPFITANEEGDEITFLRGNWQVMADIVIPSGLTVVFEPGCELHFASDVVLLSFSAFHAVGTESEPVLFSAIGETWPGMIVIDAADESLLEHVLVEKTGGIERGGWILTGGITFYRSPVVVKNSTFQDSVVEDAINVIRTTFTFDHLTIQRSPSDAFDSDFANGDIIDCHFEDIGGDAVDISGAYVHVSGTSMVNITDKGLSAGEDSHMTAENLSIVNVGIGGVAKDLSTLAITDSVIQKARVAGLAAYIKKAVFGPSSIEAQDVQILDTATETLVQTGSLVIWNGKEQATKDLNVKTLYALGILGN